eukprot:TRINITY_DN43025_c0_g1_i1.p1 TRINITY_DN43025_c0_g1~~TRINITY_DN43025_c0_g1_i1.p1  ORF type:complete len:197 (+),score=60.08 TRINITY_DN43025_c0_g1_i1:38-628(+)
MGTCCSSQSEVVEGGDIERDEQLLREARALAAVYGGDLVAASLANKRCATVWAWRENCTGPGIYESHANGELQYQDLRFSAVDMPHNPGSDVSSLHMRDGECLTAVHPLARKHMLVLFISYRSNPTTLATLDLEQKALASAPHLANVVRIALTDSSATRPCGSEAGSADHELEVHDANPEASPNFVGVGVGAGAGA